MFLLFSGWVGEPEAIAGATNNETNGAINGAAETPLGDSDAAPETASESINAVENMASVNGELSLDALLVSAQDALQNQEWISAAERLEQIRLSDPAFQSERVQSLLATAYVSAGRDIIADSDGETYRIQDAQALLRQAEAIEPDNDETRRVIEEVNTYLVGARALRLESLQQAADILQPLYAISPDYLRGQVGARLYETYVAIGDRAMRKSNTQVAVDYYGRAQTIGEVADKAGLTARLASLEQVRTAQVTPLSPTPTFTPLPPPTAVPPTAVPPTAVPPTAVPPTAVPAVVNQAPVFVEPSPTPTFTPPPTAPPPPVVSVPPTPTSVPLSPASCPDPRAVITSPLEGETVNGWVQVKGRAVHEEFKYYKVEFGRVESDRFSFLVSEEIQTFGDGDELAIWNTSEVPDGNYRLRLTVVREDGNYPPPCDVSVVIKNNE